MLILHDVHVVFAICLFVLHSNLMDNFIFCEILFFTLESKITFKVFFSHLEVELGFFSFNNYYIMINVRNSTMVSRILISRSR